MVLKFSSEEELINLILKTCPKLDRKNLISKNINLVDDGYLDSFDIIQIITGIEKINKKIIKPNKLKRGTFKNLNSILKLLNK